MIILKKICAKPDLGDIKRMKKEAEEFEERIWENIKSEIRGLNRALSIFEGVGAGRIISNFKTQLQEKSFANNWVLIHPSMEKSATPHIDVYMPTGSKNKQLWKLDGKNDLGEQLYTEVKKGQALKSTRCQWTEDQIREQIYPL